MALPSGGVACGSQAAAGSCLRGALAAQLLSPTGDGEHHSTSSDTLVPLPAASVLPPQWPSPALLHSGPPHASLYPQSSPLVLHISKFELFEISKFRNILMAIFNCQLLHFLLSCREKKRVVVLIYMHKIMHVLRYANKNLIFCSFYILTNCKLYFSFADMAKKMFCDSNFLN